MHSFSHLFDKLCISLTFIIRIYHDARSSECQIQHAIYSLVGYQVTDGGTDFSPPKVFCPLCKNYCFIYYRDYKGQLLDIFREINTVCGENPTLYG
jgi:hypothetical protein